MRGKTIFLVLTGLAWLGAGLAVAQPTVNVTITYVSTGKTYQVATANPGEYLYTDRDRTYGYRFMPDRTTPAPDPSWALETTAPVLLGQKFIRVSNDDKNQTVARYLEFTIDKPCTIYIAYDKRGLPASLGGTGGDPADWLEDGTWTLTPYSVIWCTDNATPGQDGSSPMPVFAKDFEAGTVTLGGPRFGTYATVDTNYIPFIVPKDPTYNPPPAVDVEPEYQKVYLGEGGAALTATVTDEDPEEGEPGVLTWYWAKESGPGDVTFSPSTPNETEVTASFSAKGIYRILCQATDGSEDANDVVTVVVADRADEQLVGYWDMEQNVLDQSINSNDGELVGDADYTDDSAIGDSAMNLITEDAADPNALGYVYLGPAPELDFAYPGDFSVAAWVKTTSTEQSNIFTKGGDEDGGIRYILSVGETDNPRGRAELILDDNVNKVVVTGSKLINDGKWHLVVGVRDMVSARVYVDGVLEASAAVPAGYDLSGTSQTGAYIGIGILSPFDADRADPNSPYDVYKAGAPQKDLNGLVDDVRVYNWSLVLEDEPGYDSVRSLAAMGPLPAVVDAGPDETYLLNPSIPYHLQGSVTDLGRESGNVALWQVQSTVPAGLPEPMFSDDGTNPAGTVQFLDGGVYVLQLTVLDGDYPDDPISDTVTITVETPTCQDVIDAGLLLPGDLNQDCEVNLADLALMLEKWTLCNDPADPDCPWPF